MKHNYLKHLFTALLLLCATVATAHDFEVGGIYYNITDAVAKTVAVTYKGGNSTSYSNEYSGAATIPASVTYNGSTYSVTTIGNYAFYKCNGLTSIEIPNSVTTIEDYAFSNCTGLTSVTIPNSVTEIGISAFGTCTGLTSVEFNAENCTSMSNSYNNPVFYGCTNLSTITIGENVKTIPSYAFNNCTSLTSIEIPNSVTTIGESAFDNTAWYNNQPDGVVYAGKVLYKYKGTMPANTTITIKEGTASIADKAFYNCRSLKSVTIPNSVTSIGSYAFVNCSSLTSITIPNSVTSIGYEAFYGTAWYNNQPDGVVYAGKVLYKYKGKMPSNTSITVKEGTLGIAGGAFEGYSGLTSITIPNSVTTIENDAFQNCSSLRIVTVESGNTKYDSREGCNAIIETATNTLIVGCKNTTIPNSVTTIGDNAFYYCEGLTSITIPNSVTTIGSYAFVNCRSLTSITIPNSVTTIGKYAFLNCSSLTSIEIPNSVTTIENYAFQNCSSLTSVTIPNSVTTIGKYTFWNCTGLTSVTIPNSVTSIGGDAFYGCTGLTSIEIPNSVTTIGEYTFWNCTGLTSVTIPNSVTAIGFRAFGYCTSLTSVEFNAENCTSMGSIVFEDCTNLSTITIGENVKTIPSYAFYGCNGLTSITIGNNVTSIGGSAFSGCYGLTAVHISNLSAWCKINFSGSESNPLSNARNLYLNGDKVTNLVIPDDITEIKDYAFHFCNDITSITIPNSVTSIGNNAFTGCDITSITIPNSVTSIGKYAFSVCTDLKTVINYSNLTLTQGSSNYGYVAYYADKVINAPNGSIEGDFIWGVVNGLNTLCGYIGNGGNLTIPADYNGENYAIGNSAFSGCSSLTSIEIPNSVKSIGNGAFSGCSSLTSITIGNNVTTIGNGAFSSCTALKSIRFEDGAETLSLGYRSYNSSSTGKGLFYDCPLDTVYIGRDLSYETSSQYGYSPFYNKTTLTAVEFGDSVTTIVSKAFYNCTGLTSITIPNSVTSIGGSAFSGCTGLTNVTIGNSVTSIGNYAFSYCKGLTSVTSLIPANELFAIDSYVFYNVDKTTCTLYVPYGAKETYAATAGWNEFANIVELEPAGIEDMKAENGNGKTVYDLRGRVVETPANGIYIINGKKVLVK